MPIIINDDGSQVFVPDADNSMLYIILLILFFMAFGGGGWYYNTNYSDAAVLAKTAADSANSANASAQLAVIAAAGANSTAANNSANNAADTAAAASIAAAVAKQASADADLDKAKKASDDASALAEATRKSLETTMNILKGVNVAYIGNAYNDKKPFDFYCNNTLDDYIKKISFKYNTTGINNIMFECKSGKTSDNYGSINTGENVDIVKDAPFNNISGRGGWWVEKLGPHGGSGGSYTDFNCPPNQVIKGVSGMSDKYLGKIGFRCAPNAV